MPASNTRIETQRRGGVYEDSGERWTMPLGRLAGIRLGLSYTAFLAAGILIAVLLTFSGRPGNSDLIRITALGAAFWVSGWLAQIVAYCGLTWLLGLRMSRLSVGLFGVESIPRKWPAIGSLITSVGTIGSLLMLGVFYRLVEGGFQMPVLAPAPTHSLSAPSIGFESHDSIWWSGAWLCWVQSLCQIYPLQRTMGRQLIGACCAIAAHRFDLPIQTAIFRRCITMVALLMLVVAFVMMTSEQDRLVPQWTLLALLSLLLWFSSRASDIPMFLLGFDSGREIQRRAGLIALVRGVLRSRRNQKRLRKTLEQERSEAIEASRLDAILNQLHKDGIDSLAAEDRKILERVSKNLRKQRQAQSDSAEEVGD